MRLGNERFRKANAVPVGGLVQVAVRDIGAGPAVLLDMLVKRWNGIVGDANARNTRPVNVDGEVLTIAVSSPVWITQARFMKTSFIEKINRFLGESGQSVRDIAFTLDTKRK